jgi:type I restriction enzyme S subunit
VTASWPEVTLNQCVSLVAGFPFKSEGFTDNPDDVPLVKGENVGQGSIFWDIAKRWPASDWEKMAKFQLIPDDVIIAMDRPWVPAGLKWSFIRDRDPKALLVQRCARLRTTDGRLDQVFLRFVIGGPAFENYVKPVTTGVNVPHISGKQILDFSFLLPPLLTQKRIASILSVYDELIENSQRRISILEAMAHSIYHEWFVHFRYRGQEALRRISSPIGDIPEGWSIKPVKELADVTYGFPFQSKRFNTNGIGTPVIRIRDILDSSTKTFTDEDADPKYRVKDGDILVGMDGDFHMCIWSGGDAFLNQRVARFESRGEIGNRHLFLALGLPIQTWNKSIVGTTVAHLGDTHIKAIQLVWPPPELLIKAKEVLEPLSAQIISLKRRVQNLRKTRDLLLPRLLSGQIEVQAH